ncbi:NAD(P)-dependent oxidoreductase [Streptomyces sp. NPDC096310]|uniref:NAD(P)-dependent oxidoreductase n=1 Tax=Streptomyces sp. NPDC096310 TaxID=3366082 RepID=UPI003803439C
MNLAVLGASGGVGRQIVLHALADGHRVKAGVRDPARLDLTDAHLTVLRADALDAGSVGDVVEGVDTVLSGVGPAARHDPLRPASTSARALVAAMSAAGVRRLVVVSAAPLNRTGVAQTWLAHRVITPMMWVILREVYTDLELMERTLADSDLDWTSVRPPRLTNGAGRGIYRHAIDAGPPGNRIARADVARAMLDFMAAPETVRHVVGVSE